MTDGDMLAKALDDVRRRRIDLQADHERIGAELAKLRLAERSLAAIVEGTPLDDAGGGPAADRDALAEARPRGAGRGSRGPRANSAKGRLKALIDGAGAQGLSQAEIARRLTDVAPNTLNTYLSMMVTSGEAVRRGDFFAPGTPVAAEDEADAAEASPEDDDEAAPEHKTSAGGAVA